MNLLLQPVLEALLSWAEQYERDEEVFLACLDMYILGQLSLMLHPDPRLNNLPLAATYDLDAIFKGPYIMAQKAKELFQEKQQLIWDIDSEKIWLPEETTYTQTFSATKLNIHIVDPLFALTSKAVKAKEKNKILIQYALNLFGPELREFIEHYGGNINDFR